MTAADTYPAYSPRRHDDPIVLSSVGKWADAPDEDMAAVMNRRVWVTAWHTPLTGCRWLRTMHETGVCLDPNGRPVNPSPDAHNGQVGRGLLGRWGVNHAADPVVTTFLDGGLHVLCVLRADRKGFCPALPGGMVEIDPETGAPEGFGRTLERELFEEALQAPGREDFATADEVKRRLHDGTVLYTGIVHDPRNTRNAWIETIAVHAHLPTELALRCKLRVDGDDEGETRGAFWLRVTDLTMSMMYNPSHARYIRMAEARAVLLPIVQFIVGLAILAAVLTSLP